MLLIVWNNLDENMKHKNNEKHKTISIVAKLFKKIIGYKSL